MRLILEGQPALVHLGVWVSVAILLASFGGALCGIYLTLTRTEALATRPDEEALSYWERAARKNSRVSGIFIQPDLKNLRYLLYASIIGFFGSFGLLFVIIGVFGEQG
jgi:hypothetical protein